MKTIEDLERLLKDGKLTRRKFLTLTSAMGLTALISPQLLVNPVEASTPKRGGRLRIGYSGGATNDTLDVSTVTSTMMQAMNQGQLRNYMVAIDHNNKTVPDLAESWEPTPDAKQWVFKLRKGVEFHSGKTLDADDVIYTINKHRGKDSKSGAKGLLAPIVDIKKDGNTVIFTLESGNADFPYVLSDWHLSICQAESDFSDGMGTGPFILKNFEPGVSAFAVRNPNYWKPGLPYFDEVETLVIVDETARTNALMTGEVDAIDQCALKTVHLLEGKPGIQVMQTAGGRHYTFPMRCDTAPYDNNDVRLALKYAIDREQMLKQILSGYGTVGNDHPIAPSNPYYASDLEQRKYDPEKSKYHLKKAGLKDATFSLHIADAAFMGAVDSAVLYKESAAKAGINIEVVREPNDGYWSDIWMKKPWTASFWGGRPTADMILGLVYAADASWNDTYWKHERCNELLVAARAELDDNKRRPMYVEIQQIIRDEGGAVIPMFANNVFAATGKLGHGPLTTLWPLDDFKCAERWWFK